MLTLNLISKELKQKIKLRHLYLFIKKNSLLLIIITIVIAIILLTAKIILQLNFNRVVEQTTLVTRNNQSYNNKVQEINNKINFIEDIQNDFIPWSGLLKIIADITPPGVNLYYFKVSSEEQTAIIRGRAYLRDDLLDFKNKMEATNIFEEINFPIKNILKKENIDFEINAKINLSNL